MNLTNLKYKIFRIIPHKHRWEFREGFYHGESHRLNRSIRFCKLCNYEEWLFISMNRKESWKDSPQEAIRKLKMEKEWN